MKIRKSFCLVLSLLLVLAMFVGCSGGGKKAYPTKSINGTVSWGAGGATDMVSRAVSKYAEEELGQTIVIANKAGAAGSLGMSYVYEQPADGYNILFCSEPPGLYKVLGTSDIDYEDFVPICLFSYSPAVIVVCPDSPYQTLEDFVADAKANPGKINVGSTGLGGGPHVTFSVICAVEGININFITYEGEGPGVAALLGGQIDITSLTAAAASQYIQSGQLRALGIMSNEKNPLLTDLRVIGQEIPAYSEYVRYCAYFGAFVREDTPDDVVETLTNAYAKAMENEELNKMLSDMGNIVLNLSGQEAADYCMGWKQTMSWLMYDAGAAPNSPEDFGIKRP
jgi:tripartite-type tricarboxylate transporter receptor subunit TctC